MARAGIQPDQTITFDQDDFLNKREFEDDELVLIVEGKGANGRERGKTAQLPEGEIKDEFSCYRLEQPNLWYIRGCTQELTEPNRWYIRGCTQELTEPNRWYIRGCTQELTEKLNNKATKMRTEPDGPVLLFKFQHKAEEVTRLRMLWVPPNLHLDAVRRLAESVFCPEVTVERPNERRDLSSIDMTMPIRDHGEIPYYIPYNKRTEFGTTEEVLKMVSVKGRKQLCYHC